MVWYTIDRPTRHSIGHFGDGKMIIGLDASYNVLKVQIGLFTNQTHSVHTHAFRLTAIFPGEPGLAGCPLNSPSPFFPYYNCASFWDRHNA